MDDVLQRLRAELGGRYEVEHEVGRGGMAVVYLARDLRHERRVALKVLRPDIGVAGAADRFLREIHTAAQLHHPHILPLYDSGTAGEHLFYVMPYVEGETVRERLERSGPFPVDDAVRITSEVADALEFAHERGIVHRDIKPENIFLSAGHAAVGDFGIARAADAAGIKLTETGMAVGTPAYMSPEQATADLKVDGRSDQYALACVLYEMLAGQPPFTGPTSQSIMARHTTDPVPPLTTVRAVPVALETVVRKALSKVPADRWPSTRAFADSLERAVPARIGGETVATTSSSRRTGMQIAAGAAVALVVGILGWRALAGSSGGTRTAAGESDSLQSVAVLPFAFRGDTAHALIADGLTEGLITGLVRVEGLSVPATGRVAAFRDRHDDLRSVGRQLGVSTIVSAVVQVLGNRLRVTAELTNVADGRLLWRQNFDGALLVNGAPVDLFAIQDEFATKIVEAIKPRLAGSARSVVARGVRTRDPVAWDLYLQSRRNFTGTKESYERSIALLEEAVRRDSMFADAWLDLAEKTVGYSTDYAGVPQLQSSAKAKNIIDRVIALDSLNALAFAQRGAHSAVLWNWDGALRDIRRALRLAPGSADVVFTATDLFGILGEPDSALAYARRGVTLDSLNPMAWASLGNRYFFVGILDSARAASERSRALEASWGPNVNLMHVYLALSRRADADSAAASVLRGLGRGPSGLGLMATYYWKAGNSAAARRTLEELDAMARLHYVQPSAFMRARMATGDRAGALDALEQGVRDHDIQVIGAMDALEPQLRGDPRFESALRTIFGNRPRRRAFLW